jgi:uncharacterized RDD family membrane protein YckC
MAIVNVLIVGLCILVITLLLSLYTLDIGRLYPGYLIWGRSLIRLALAAVLYFPRPRQTQKIMTDTVLSQESRAVRRNCLIERK